jgi:hypothetical protein
MYSDFWRVFLACLLSHFTYYGLIGFCVFLKKYTYDVFAQSGKNENEN